MKGIRSHIQYSFFALAWLCTSSLIAGDVNLRLSSRETYVGVPIELRIDVMNASEYRPPEFPKIPGLEIRSAGAPMQSSQIQIIQNQRFEQTTTTLRYLITPEKTGSFEIPSVRFSVDSQNVSTSPLRFTVTESETNDLMYVEVESDEDEVYVGQPLKLKLNIWVKPYRDQRLNVIISEADMWRMLSKATDWGIFRDRMQELAENRQRVRGEAVLRKDENGVEREYYLYSIEAEIYPKKPGEIEGDSIRIVMNYPTKLGRPRDPFSRMFDDMGGSIFSDDSFPSPFRSSLAVTEQRPITAAATVDSVNVKDVPLAGRPGDYRGAVGRYSIRASATPQSVSAGDPITLNFAISGTGPLELVQAPPLSTLPEFTRNFTVRDDPLAGFVRNGVKYFSTTIRPKQEGITEIPSIPLSYFDPEIEAFETSFSEPIPITVDEAEQLDLSSIDSAIAATDDTSRTQETMDEVEAASSIGPEALVSQSVYRFPIWWYACVIGAPAVWATVMLAKFCMMLAGWSTKLRSALIQCRNAIGKSQDISSVVGALADYMVRTFPASEESLPEHSVRSEVDPWERVQDRFATGVGQLRLAGGYDLAAQCEAWLSRVIKFEGEWSAGEAEPLRKSSQQLLEALAAVDRKQVRRTEGRSAQSWTRVATASRGAVVILALLGFCGAVEAAAQDSGTDLTGTDLNRVLKEASRSYRLGLESLSDSGKENAMAKSHFEESRQKFQWLVDQGIQNSRLYVALADSEFQSGQPERAAAHYQAALLVDPNSPDAWLKLAKAREAGSDGSDASSSESVTQSLRSILRHAWFLIGPRNWLIASAMLAVACGGLAIAASFGGGSGTKYFAFGSGSVLALMLVCIAIAVDHSPVDTRTGVVVGEVTLRMGADVDAALIEQSKIAAGESVAILGQRSQWMQVESSTGSRGWLLDNLLVEMPK